MIVYCCPDLIFATKIHSTAEALGIACRPARDAAMLTDRLNRVDDGKGCEPVTGVIVDLTLGEPALGLIDLAKRHPDKPRVVAYAPHVEVAMLEAAEQHGADKTLPRGAFSAMLPDLLQELAVTP